MTNAVGPVFTGGFEEFVTQDESGAQYTILYLPDLNNDKLQREGKPPVYYWVPGTIRMARFGDTGDFKFRHMHFVGVLNEDLHAGVEGRAEVTGGLLSFTTTARYPTAILQQAEQQLLNKFRGDDNRYWGWRTRAAPQFSIAPIRSNTVSITNLAPGADGTAAAEGISNGAGGGAPGVPGNPSGGSRNIVGRADLNQRVIHGRNSNISNLDAWAWQLQGQGPGSVTGGENAYAGLIGALPSEMIWAGFKGGSSPISVAQNMQMPVWSQEIYIKITGEWDRIFQHFSAHANASYLWFAGDIKAEFNQLRISGGINVELQVDGTIPGAGDMTKEIDKRIDMVIEKFMQQASQRIFEPAPPEVEAAEAPSGGIFSSIFGGGGLALKYRRDETKLKLFYEETRNHRYLQPNTISSSFEGFYNAIKSDPEAEKKYFTRLILGDLSRKVTRVVKPVVNWPDPAKEWVGEPVAFLSAEIGYPGPTGSLQWLPNVFQSTDTTDQTTWKPAFALREKDEIANPPQGWEPDKAYIRRRVHLSEPIGATDNRYVKIDVEKNVIEIDPIEGTLSSEQVLEVRADSVGKLEVGPIEIDAMLQDASQVINVEFMPRGRKHDGSERTVTKFDWHHDDVDAERFWEIYTGQLDYTPFYDYRVQVTVKGTIFTPGMSWRGPWVEGQGNGPLMVHVPRPDEAGVTSRNLTAREIMSDEPIDIDRPDAGMPVITTPTAPPTTVSGSPVPVTNGSNGANGSNGSGSGTGMPPSTTTKKVDDDMELVGGYNVGKSVGSPPDDNDDSASHTDDDKRGVPSEPYAAEKPERLELVPEGWIEE